MTAPTLPDTLARLAELLPLRVRIDPHREASYAEVRVRGEWQYVYYITPDSPAWASHGLGEMWLEAALREECRARDWFWEVNAHRATVSPDWDRTRYTVGWQEFHPAPYSSVHALALAMLAALSDSE